MFSSGTAMAALAALLKPIAEAFFSAFGEAVSDWLTARRAEQAQRELGRVTAERDQAVAANKVKDAELEAAAGAPKDVDEAIARLEEGSA